MFDLDWATAKLIGSSAVGIITILVLAYLVRDRRWPRPKVVNILIWAVIWATGGAIVGLVDDEIGQATAIIAGAFWGALLALVQETGWTLRKE